MKDLKNFFVVTVVVRCFYTVSFCTSRVTFLVALPTTVERVDSMKNVMYHNRFEATEMIK